jgi:hypothetical protein
LGAWLRIVYWAGPGQRRLCDRGALDNRRRLGRGEIHSWRASHVRNGRSFGRGPACPAAFLAQYPRGGFGICKCLRALANATSEIPYRAATFCAGSAQTDSRSPARARVWPRTGAGLLLTRPPNYGQMTRRSRIFSQSLRQSKLVTTEANAPQGPYPAKR